MRFLWLPIALLVIIPGALGFSERLDWELCTCPPSSPFTYCVVAEDGWIMLAFDDNRQHLALLWPWKTEILDPYSGEGLASLSPPSRTEFQVGPAFNKDGSLIGLPVSDGTVRVWDWRAEVEVHAFQGASWGNTPAFSHDGKLLAALGREGEIIVWNLERETPVFSLLQLQTFEGPFVLGFGPGDQHLFVRARFPASGAHLTAVWDTQTGQLIQILPGMPVVSPEGLVYLLEPGRDGRTRLWRWNEAEGSVDPLFVVPGPMTGASLSRDGRVLALALADGTVSLVDMKRRGQELGRLNPGLAIQNTKEDGRLVYAFFFPDCCLVATATWVWGTSRAYVHLWNISGFLEEGE